MKPEKIDEDSTEFGETEQIKTDTKEENSASFPFNSDDVQTFDLSSAGNGGDADDDQAQHNQQQLQQHENQEAPQHTDSIDNLLANLAEDNANSLPSGDDETTFVATAMNDESIRDHIGDDDGRNESIDELVAAEELPETEISGGVDDGSYESITEPAIAEDLLNGSGGIGGGGDSQSTKMDVDAEMVSEDELPAPSQEKVDDAEEVSDEELPGPKLAELPADTEVVSEDELPTAASKSKRKVDEGYDPGSPTESSEVPEKKSKSEDAAGNGGGGGTTKADVGDDGETNAGAEDDGKSSIFLLLKYISINKW